MGEARRDEMIRQYELVERVKSYDPNADEDALNRAYVFSMKAHGDQARANGDPYFSHPLEVANILSGMRLDTASIITGLLHDTVEDTKTTLKEVEGLFGSEVARLVNGVTKLSKLELQSDRTKYAENFRKLVLATSNDIRVLLVKLADRLHNMQTLHFINDPQKRQRIARETLEIYAPLAERMGIQWIKERLEDLSFAELFADTRQSILERLGSFQQKDNDIISRISTQLQEALKKQGIEATVTGREKTPYSIWRKMQTRNVSFDQLSDIMAFRIVVDDVPQCYQALGIMHNVFFMVPGHFKDYISTPKPNGYQSLHTGIIGPEQQRIEIQIRTQKMHDVAEHGVAAHWEYKQGAAKQDGRQYRWLRELLDILENASDPEEFLEHTKLEMFQDQVFCFTPKGDLFALPKGATSIDFAYAIHSDIGNHCARAKVNGSLVPLRTQLQNGDVVEIITSRTQTPSPAWERIVVTGKARSCIRRYIRMQNYGQLLEAGKLSFQKFLKNESIDINQHGAYEGLYKKFKFNNMDDFFLAFGENKINHKDIIDYLKETHTQILSSKLNLEQTQPFVVDHDKSERKPEKILDKSGPISGLVPGMAFHFAGCCHPLPGDKIVGIVRTGRGVTIHTKECENLTQFHDQLDRWLDVSWNTHGPNQGSTGRLNVMMLNKPGALGTLATTIGKTEANINNLKIKKRSDDFFELLIDLEVKSLDHLMNIIASLKALPMVSLVERVKN